MSLNNRFKADIPDYALSRRQTIKHMSFDRHSQAYIVFGRWILQLQEIARGTAPTKKQKRWCPTPKKQAYATLDQAIKAWIHARNHFGANQQAYKCQCGKFHNATVKR